jgi:hypothetical protein
MTPDGPVVIQTQAYGPIRVNAAYDSGNIEVVDCSDPRNIQVKIRQDPFCAHDNITHYQYVHVWTHSALGQWLRMLIEHCHLPASLPQYHLVL